MAGLTLPFSGEVNAEALARTFEKTTNSYKFLFLTSLLNILERCDFELPESRVPLYEIVVEMLILAWHPYVERGLSLGKQDKLGDFIDDVRTSANTNTLEGFERYLRSGGPVEYPFERYAPYRLLHEFFQDELHGVPDGKKNRMIRDLSLEFFEERKPIYYFEGKGTIVLHPDWIRYFQQNIVAVREWLFNRFEQYLASRNPAVRQGF